MLAATYAQSVYDGIRDYEDADAEIATFGCVLRSEVEEGFVLVQRQLKATVVELLRLHTRSRMPYKTDTQVGEVVRRKMASSVTDEEWTAIVQYMCARTPAHRSTPRYDRAPRSMMVLGARHTALVPPCMAPDGLRQLPTHEGEVAFAQV